MKNSMRLIQTFLLLAAAYLAALAPSSAATLLPNGEQTFVDANGSPIASGTVDFYITGTLTRKNTWLSSTTTNPNLNTNPVVLDSAGRAVIYGIGCYRQIVKDALSVTQWDKTTCSSDSNSDSWGGTATGTPNAIIVTANNFTGADGQVIRFIAASNNSGATTVNPTVAGVAFGNVSLVVDGGSGPIAATGGEIIAGNVVTLVYDANLGVFHLATLTSVTAGAGLSTAGVGSSGGTGATAVTLTSVKPVNAQTGTTYTLLNTDNAKLVTFSNTSSIAVTVPNATGNFAAGYSVAVLNLNVGLVTLTPAVGTINGLGSITLTYLGSGQLTSDGTNWTFIGTGSTQGSPSSSSGYSNLLIINTVGQENDHIGITADTATLRRVSGYSFTVASVNVTCTYSANWAGGGSLDTGSLAANTWYYHWIISNGVTTACLGSTSATSPTLPSGYIFKMRVGANRTDGSVHFNRVRQLNNRAQYIVSSATTTALPIMDSGTKGNVATPTWVAVATGTFVPTTASQIIGVLSIGSGAIVAAPNNLYGGNASTTNPPPISGGNSAGATQAQFTFLLETTNIYWASAAATGLIQAMGWVDNL